MMFDDGSLAAYQLALSPPAGKGSKIKNAINCVDKRLTAAY